MCVVGKKRNRDGVRVSVKRGHRVGIFFLWRAYIPPLPNGGDDVRERIHQSEKLLSAY